MQLNEDLFLQSIIAQLKQPGVIGIGVVGSYARGESKKYSDVDIDIFLEKLPADTYTLRFMNGLQQEHESKVLYASWGMFKGLSFSVLVQAGLMIESENRAFDMIQDHLGRGHAWTRAFRLSFGMDLGDMNIPAYQTRGRAALDLYRETAIIFGDIINDQHRDVIENTLQLIETYG